MTDWQPIDTAPRDGRWLLMHCKGWPIAALARHDLETGNWHALAPFKTEGSDDGAVWQPLPPPKEAANAP